MASLNVTLVLLTLGAATALSVKGTQAKQGAKSLSEAEANAQAEAQQQAIAEAHAQAQKEYDQMMKFEHETEQENKITSEDITQIEKMAQGIIHARHDRTLEALTGTLLSSLMQYTAIKEEAMPQDHAMTEEEFDIES